MPLIMRFDSADLLQCRFAVSPLTETTDALRSLVRPVPEVYHLPWQRQVRPRLPGLRLEPLLALLAWSDYQPDFLAPAPDSPFTEVGRAGPGAGDAAGPGGGGTVHRPARPSLPCGQSGAGP